MGVIASPRIQRVLDMTATQVRALNDGQFFLAHGADVLAALAIEPFCRACLADGRDARIATVDKGDSHDFGCQHRRGNAKKGRPLDLAEFLHACDWNLWCTRCREAVVADNAKTDKAFTVTCSCTIRRLVNPLARPAGVPAVAGLGQ